MRLLLLGLAVPLASAELSKIDSEAFDRYAAQIEATLGERAKGSPYLWIGDDPSHSGMLKGGGVVITSSAKPNPKATGHSLIHDWAGAVFIPKAKIDAVLAVLQDFNRHKAIYPGEVVDSKLLSKDGTEYQSYLRLKKKKVLTVILNTEYRTKFYRPSEKRAYSIVHSTKIAEVKNAGEPDERELPQGTGYGFLWRLNSYWLLEERDGGVFAECRAVSLTRDVPAIVNWAVAPMVRSLPKESLEFTLENTRRAVNGGQAVEAAR
jgi:hypothetical protein